MIAARARLQELRGNAGGALFPLQRPHLNDYLIREVNLAGEVGPARTWGCQRDTWKFRLVIRRVSWSPHSLRFRLIRP